MRIAALTVAALLTGCAAVSYADGKTVAVEHGYHAYMADVQEAADAACVQSGGKAPAQFVTRVPKSPAAPALYNWTYTFRCAGGEAR